MAVRCGGAPGRAWAETVGEVASVRARRARPPASSTTGCAPAGWRPAELLLTAGLLVCGLGALGFALGGTGFLLWCLVLGGVAAPFVRVAVRRRRRELARSRVRRRAARIAAHREVWRTDEQDAA